MGIAGEQKRADTGERHCHSQAGARRRFSREQVEALAEYLDGQLATNDLSELRADVKSDLNELRGEFRELEPNMTEREARLRLWKVGQVFVKVGALGTLGYFR